MLEISHHAFQRTRHEAKVGVGACKDKLEDLGKRHDKVKRDIEHATGNTTLEIGGRVFNVNPKTAKDETKAEVEKFAKTFVTAFLKDKANQHRSIVELGTISGLKLFMIKDRGSFKLIARGETSYQLSTKSYKGGMFESLWDLHAEITKELGTTVRGIHYNNSKIVAFEENMGGTFEQASELAELKARQGEVNLALAEDANKQIEAQADMESFDELLAKHTNQPPMGGLGLAS
jgi:hypothetical protein